MKKYILLILGLTIISCGGSSEDDDMDDNNSETFLEKYNGNVYRYIDDEDSDWILHFFFYDSIYFWGYVDDEIDPDASDEYQTCLKLKEGNNPDGGDNIVISIISEDEDEIIIEIISAGDEETYITVYTFEVEGENLNVTINDGEITSFTMTKVNNITYEQLCN